MISPVFLWLPAFVIAVAAAAGAAFWIWRRRAADTPRTLPDDWQLSPRPVFSTDERRVYRLLREALPDHAILAKLPLVRFTQPDDPNEVAYWYQLLGTTHVAFAICSASGRVLAAIDLDSDSANSRRTLQIKQSVLGACRVRYLRCPMDQLPTVAELRSLVPPTVAPRAAPARTEEPIGAAGLTRPRSPAPAAATDPLWREPAPYHDSFFALENRPDDGSTDFGGLGSTREMREPRESRTVDLRLDDPAGIVSDIPLPDLPPRR